MLRIASFFFWLERATFEYLSRNRTCPNRNPLTKLLKELAQQLPHHSWDLRGRKFWFAAKLQLWLALSLSLALALPFALPYSLLFSFSLTLPLSLALSVRTIISSLSIWLTMSKHCHKSAYTFSLPCPRSPSLFPPLSSSLSVVSFCAAWPTRLVVCIMIYGFHWFLISHQIKIVKTNCSKGATNWPVQAHTADGAPHTLF